MLVVVPIIAVAAAVIMCLVMWRSGKIDEAPIVSAIMIAIVSGIGATIAVVLIYMIGNMMTF
jgi:uncharacterized membrane protein YhiD involved in acid resistance